MRKVLAPIVFMLALFAPAVSLAQGYLMPSAPPWVFADNFGRWALQGQVPNTFTFQVSGFSPCSIVALNFESRATFYAFSATVGLAPVLVADANAAESEVLTPTTFVAPTPQSCGPNLAALNQHTTFSLQSGTGGLQEAINFVGAPSASWPSTIFLTPEWYKLVSNIASQNSTLAAITPATIKAAAKCSPNALVVDITTAPWTQYVCGGASGYVVGTQFYLLSTTPPTVAAGTGAGTAPTIAISGNSAVGTVTLTTGTAVPAAADPIFVLTWPAKGASGAPTSGYQYAPVCTFTSTGTAPGTTTNTSTSGASSPATATLTSPAAGLTSSTAGYSWTYSCR
jgi:hypothetical protein